MLSSQPSNYPIDSSLNNGACDGDDCNAYCATAQPAGPDAVLARQCAQKATNERQGNNPYSVPNQYTPHASIGCMNPSCLCGSCDGACVCGRANRVERFGFNDFFADKDWTFWGITFLVAYLMYHFLKTRAK